MKKITLIIGLICAQFSWAQQDKHTHTHDGSTHSHEHVKVYEAPVYEEGWNLPGIEPDRIILSYGEDPATMANVNWRTNTDVKAAFAEIAVAKAEPKFWRESVRYVADTELLDTTGVLSAGEIVNYHSVSFKGLEPNTLYAYRVGDGKHWSEWIQFKTASQNPERFSFLYVGDAQNYILELWSRLIRQGFQKAPDAKFIVHAGDLVSTANDDNHWEEWFRAGSFIHKMVPAFPVPGNHEYRPRKKGEKKKLSVFWRPQFNLPKNGPKGMEENVYFMDFQGVRMIGLDSNFGAENTEMLCWLEEKLSNNPNKWTILTYHHPVFSASKGRNNDEWRAKLQPILKKYKVDLVLQGHDHSYARGRITLEENVMDGLNARDLTGTVYVVSVSGGKMYNLRPNAWDGWEADRERAAENTQLFQVITVDGDILKFESYTATGDLYDAFEIIKNNNGTNRFVELQHQAISGRYHDNTISYRDELPLDIKEKILSKYKGYAIDKVSLAYDDDRNVVYKVSIENKQKVEYDLVLNQKGEFLSEELDD